MKSNKELLAFAQKYLGQGGARFRNYCSLPSGAAWCNAFVTYIFHEGGDASLYCNGKKQTYCPTSMKLCAKDMAQIPLYLAMPMDVIYFDWDKNGVPNHIGFVKAHKDTSSIYTIEGNTDGGKVANKTRAGKYVCAIYRPHFKASFTLKKLTVDGDCGYNTIAGLQKALGCTVDGILGRATVKALQKRVGVTQDGQWGNGTSKAVQKLIGVKQDGAFGPASVKALQNWINKQVYPSNTKPSTSAPTVTNAQKIVNKANELAWPYGTSSSKWDYSKGAPTSKDKTALKKHGYKTKASQSDCGNNVNTVVRECGVDKDFVSLRSVRSAFPTSSKFNIVYKGKAIPSDFLKPGDIVRYKKTSGQHALIYMGNGRVAEARHKHRFFNIYKDEKRYNGSNVKKNTIQVLRAK